MYLTILFKSEWAVKDEMVVAISRDVLNNLSNNFS